ncbi:MAG TPA: sigma-70 family RNA polymerase sigma factor [Terriglobia bacterium]|nr:sigma-70 family RNA polymerase sigma factor [Terriglobia bacterium]
MTQQELKVATSAASPMSSRIVINEALMKLRKRSSNRETESLEPLLTWKKQLEICRTSSPDEQPEKYYDSVELRSILSGALAVLSPSLSAPFLLCFLEGYSLREIAALLGLTVPAIKSRLRRARHILSKRLRRVLQPPYPAPRSEA